jgi:predicted O-methyltransferase YrrM
MEAYANFIRDIQDLPVRMGSIRPSQQHFLIDFLVKHPEIKEVLETGFHVGISAATMMLARDDIYVTSFDIFWFDYTRRAKLILDIHYPTRNILIAGNSACSLQTFFGRFSGYKPDLVFIDGGHERPIPFIDMYFIFKNIRTGTWIIIDDYCVEHGANGVMEAVNECINEGYIENVTVYKEEDRGWIVGTRSSIAVKASEKVNREALDVVYKDVMTHYT